MSQTSRCRRGGVQEEDDDADSLIGAGATGGYFGARLAQAGRDVTFLLRPGRAAAVRANGIRFTGQGPDEVVTAPVVTADEIDRPYNLALLTVKHGALESAMDDMASAVGPGTLILPFLNGMSHLDRLNQRFGVSAVLGGVVIIADMWSKWVFTATVGALTCLMRGAVGEIVAQSGGDKLGPAFLAEATAIASANGYPIADAQISNTSAVVTKAGSNLTSSMYRDVIDGHPTESDPILGDLVARGRDHGIESPLLRLAPPAASRPQRPRQLASATLPPNRFP